MQHVRLRRVYNTEFEEDSIQLFEKVKLEQIICVYSDHTEGALFEAPEKVKEFAASVIVDNRW